MAAQDGGVKRKEISLASHRSAEKRSRQSLKNRLRNTSIKSRIKTLVKSALSAFETKDQEGSKAALSIVVPAIARASSKGVLHKKTAARKISRLTRKVNALGG